MRDPRTGELVVAPSASKTRLIVLGAILGATVSCALLAVSVVTHSIWPIIPGIYAVAAVVGIHNASIFAVAVVNAILLWILAAGFLMLYRRRSGR